MEFRCRFTRNTHGGRRLMCTYICEHIINCYQVDGVVRIYIWTIRQKEIKKIEHDNRPRALIMFNFSCISTAPYVILNKFPFHAKMLFKKNRTQKRTDSKDLSPISWGTPDFPKKKCLCLRILGIFKIIY